ncbi:MULTISPECIES: hypothetical protein [Sphingobacterium]|uniref:hypothetical protein n=1 Tax=Sphingobacterium TaxID=28453 RepID=UPI0013DA80A9|nr:MULTISPECIES: hypothetical protein [unclassified Sphingobacterium]
MTKYRLFALFITLLFLNCGYAQYKKVTLSAHTNLSRSAYGSGPFYNSNDNYRDFNLIPSLSYRLNKVWAIGAGYHYGFNKSYTTVAVDIPDYYYMLRLEQRSTTNQFALFVQSYLYDNGKFAAFLEVDGVKGRTTAKSIPPDGAIVPEDIKYEKFSTGLHAGGRYTFYKGLGAEFRLNKLIQYQQAKVKGNDTKDSEFRVFENIWQNCSIGLSYQF